MINVLIVLAHVVIHMAKLGETHFFFFMSGYFHVTVVCAFQGRVGVDNIFKAVSQAFKIIYISALAQSPPDRDLVNDHCSHYNGLPEH